MIDVRDEISRRNRNTTTRKTTTMNTTLTTYDFNDHSIRIVLINGDPWFVAADVAYVLGIGLNGKYLNAVRADERRTVDRSDEIGSHLMAGTRANRVSIISESGLYKLIMRSDKPVARSFQDWVTRDVLPAIRKNGGYVMGQEKLATGEMSREEFFARALMMAQQTILEASQKLQVVEAERDELAALKAEHLEFVMVQEWAALNHYYLEFGEKVRLGQIASELCRARGLTIKQQRMRVQTRVGPKMKLVGVYPWDIVSEAYLILTREQLRVA